MAVDYGRIKGILGATKTVLKGMGYVKGQAPKTLVDYDRTREFLGVVGQYAQAKAELGTVPAAQQKTTGYKTASAELKELGAELRIAGKNMMQSTAQGVAGYASGLKIQAEKGRKFLGVIPLSSTIGYALDDGKAAVTRAIQDIGTIKDVLDATGVLTDSDKDYVKALTGRLDRAKDTLETSGKRYQEKSDRAKAEKERKRLEKDLSQFERKMRDLGI